jgi:sugar (pentulose or hexulose) kinase
MTSKRVVALDVGGESGRSLVASFDGNQLQVEEVYRFPNVAVLAGGTLYWDALRIWHDLQQGIKAAGAEVASIGLDTWGVDFALLDRAGNLIGNPIHYRDHSWEGMMDWVAENVTPRRDLYNRTALQFMAPNGIWRLAYLVKTSSPILEQAHTYLTFPDLFHYWMTGVKSCEMTHASTHMIYNPHIGGWDFDLLHKMQFPTHIFTPIIPPGTRLGSFNGIPVTAVATHDTGSAVVGVPTTTDDYAYISSGTWSLMGLENRQPIISDVAYEANIANEGGYDHTFRILKNISGMWLVQQCRAAWIDAGKTYEYAELAALAAAEPAFRSFIDVDAVEFYEPGDYPALIRAYCQRTGQPAPETVAQVMRTIYDSLAMKYRYVLDLLLRAAGRTVNRLHIIGGGSKNALLCQMTANAIARPVIAGPTEATAIGNALVQFIALGEISNLGEARAMLARDPELRHYEPQETAAWEAAYQRYRAAVNL